VFIVSIFFPKQMLRLTISQLFRYAVVCCIHIGTKTIHMPNNTVSDPIVVDCGPWSGFLSILVV